MYKFLTDFWKMLDSHLSVGLIVGLSLLAWHYAHPYIHERVVERTVAVQAPGAAPTQYTINLGGIAVPQIVYTPPGQPDVRDITTPSAVVTPDAPGIIAKAPDTITTTLLKVCGHPLPKGSAPDPTCVSPLKPDLTLVNKGDKTGWVVVQTPEEAAQLTVGQTITKETLPHDLYRQWTIRAGAGVDAFGSYWGGQVQYDIAAPLGIPLFVQGTIKMPQGGPGPVRADIFAGVQFSF